MFLFSIVATFLSQYYFHNVQLIFANIFALHILLALILLQDLSKVWRRLEFIYQLFIVLLIFGMPFIYIGFVDALVLVFSQYSIAFVAYTLSLYILWVRLSIALENSPIYLSDVTVVGSKTISPQLYLVFFIHIFYSLMVIMFSFQQDLSLLELLANLLLTSIITSIFYYVYREIYWIPKSGLVIPHTFTIVTPMSDSELVHELDALPLLTTPAEEYFQVLARHESEIREMNDPLIAVYVAEHIITAAAIYGLKGKRAKYYLLLILPRLFKRWRVFAMLPKHYQKLAHNFLEVLILIGECTEHWQAILTHEISSRYSARKRFTLIYSDSLPPTTSAFELPWNMLWGKNIYMGSIGFQNAKAKFNEQGFVCRSATVDNPISTAWERDLELASLRVFRTFFGFGSRQAWGKSVGKHAYFEHDFVLQGNMLSNFQTYMNQKREKSVQPKTYTSDIPKPEVDESYLTSYFATGQFPSYETKLPATANVSKVSINVAYFQLAVVSILLLAGTIFILSEYPIFQPYFVVFAVILLLIQINVKSPIILFPIFVNKLMQSRLSKILNRNLNKTYKGAAVEWLVLYLYVVYSF